MKRLGSLARSALWAGILGLLAVLVAGPITSHLVGPALLLVMAHPSGALWDPFIGGLSLTIAGALVVLAIGRVVQLPAKLAAAGVGGMGTLWLVLLTLLSGGFATLWGPGLVFRLAFAVAAAAVAGRAAGIGDKPPAIEPPTPAEPPAATSTDPAAAPPTPGGST